MVMLIGMIGSAQATNWTNFTDLSDGDEISGNYSLNASTYNATGYGNGSLWVNFSYCVGHFNGSWINIGANETEGNNFTVYWNTTEVCNGNYRLNATSNRTGDTYNGYVNVTVDNGDIITLTAPTAGETISTGNYTFTATTTVNRSYVNFSWYNASSGWTEFASNDTEGTVFTAVWNTTGLDDGTYNFNASTNCSIDSNTTETDDSLGVIIDNVPAPAVVDSPEFSTIMIAGLIGLLSATAILLRKKKE